MKKMTLKQFWSSLDGNKKNKLRVSMAQICGKSVDTIQAWMLGYRFPSKLEMEALCKHIKAEYKVEITD